MVVLNVSHAEALRTIARANTAIRRQQRDSSRAARVIARWLLWLCGTRREILCRTAHLRHV